MGGMALPAGRHRWLMLAAALVIIVAVLVGLDVGGLRGRLTGGGQARAVRLAVLPFENLTGDPEQEYLSDGLTQEMITHLGRLHPQGLGVIARTSVMRYKKSEASIDQIGRELGVEYVLEGSARREGSRVRVSADLIRVRDQVQLWGDVFERETSGILACRTTWRRTSLRRWRSSCCRPSKPVGQGPSRQPRRPTKPTSGAPSTG